MDNCYSGDHIAEDHIHMDTTSCNIEESQRKYRLGTDRNKLLGDLNIYSFSIFIIKLKRKQSGQL